MNLEPHEHDERDQFAEQPTLPDVPAGVWYEATWKGPYPPPAIIKQYNDISPGLGDNLVKLWLDETEHRRQRERAADRSEDNAVKRAQWIGGTVFFVLAIGAVIAATQGHAAAAAALAGADAIGGLVPVLYGWVRQRRGESQDELDTHHGEGDHREEERDAIEDA